MLFIPSINSLDDGERGTLLDQETQVIQVSQNQIRFTIGDLDDNEKGNLLGITCEITNEAPIKYPRHAIQNKPKHAEQN